MSEDVLAWARDLALIRGLIAAETDAADRDPSRPAPRSTPLRGATGGNVVQLHIAATPRRCPTERAD